VAAALSEYLVVFASSVEGEPGPAKLQDASSLASQYMRRTIADHLNLQSWDWKTDSNLEVLRKTIALGGAINQVVALEGIAAPF